MSDVIRTLVGLLFGLSMVTLPACGPEEPRLAPLTPPITADKEGASVTIKAKVRDLRPAVMRALPKFEFAPLKETGSAAEGFLEIELIGLFNDPGRVRTEFAPTDGSLAALREARSVTIRVSIGRFGDEAREQKLAERVAREVLTLGEGAE